MTVVELEAEIVRLKAEVEQHIEYTKKRGCQMLIDLAEINKLKAEIDRLKASIRIHRNKKRDDRCWIDDYELYSILNEPFDVDTHRLPCREEFLMSCGRYWEQRQPTGAPITEHPPDPEDMSDPKTLTIGQLEREIARLRAENEKLVDAWIWESSSWKYSDWKAPDEFTAWIPSHKAIGVRSQTFKSRDEARTAIRKAVGIGGVE